jgi:gamma-glutamylcyclotransferase (GGCT)/AIG2-like uncharacterized protein YtfP
VPESIGPYQLLSEIARGGGAWSTARRQRALPAGTTGSSDMTHRVHYFAYGSNMSSRAIAGRCPSARLVSKAILRDHRLMFFLEDESWAGGVAGVLPATGQVVEGVIYTLAEVDLVALDRYEAIEDDDYVRAQRRVHLPEGASQLCWIYLPGRDADRPVAPSQRYLDALLEGAREHGLSDAHLALLRAAGG